MYTDICVVFPYLPISEITNFIDRDPPSLPHPLRYVVLNVKNEIYKGITVEENVVYNERIILFLVFHCVCVITY